MVGIILALVLRGIFILLGAAVIERFTWVFYLFGAFLVYTAINSSGTAARTRTTRRTRSSAGSGKVLPITRTSTAAGSASSRTAGGSGRR